MVSGVGSSCEEGCLANSRRSLHDASVYMAARKKLSPAPRKQGSRQVALRLPFPVHFWGRAIFFGSIPTIQAADETARLAKSPQKWPLCRAGTRAHGHRNARGLKGAQGRPPRPSTAPSGCAPGAGLARRADAGRRPYAEPAHQSHQCTLQDWNVRAYRPGYRFTTHEPA